MAGEKRFTLRMDADLFEELSNAAKRHRRSTAKEVENAIALYLVKLEEREYLDSIDPSKISAEDSKNSLQKLRDITKKYNAFIK